MLLWLGEMLCVLSCFLCFELFVGYRVEAIYHNQSCKKMVYYQISLQWTYFQIYSQKSGLFPKNPVYSSFKSDFFPDFPTLVINKNETDHIFCEEDGLYFTRYRHCIIFGFHSIRKALMCQAFSIFAFSGNRKKRLNGQLLLLMQFNIRFNKHTFNLLLSIA